MHITERALTFDGVTYSLQTNLSWKLNLPKVYYGEKSEEMEENVGKYSKKVKDDDDSDSDEDDKDDLGNWCVQSSHIM